MHEFSMVIESGWPERTVDDIAPATARVRTYHYPSFLCSPRLQWATLLYDALQSRGIEQVVSFPLFTIIALKDSPV